MHLCGACRALPHPDDKNLRDQLALQAHEHWHMQTHNMTCPALTNQHPPTVLTGRQVLSRPYACVQGLRGSATTCQTTMRTSGSSRRCLHALSAHADAK